MRVLTRVLRRGNPANVPVTKQLAIDLIASGCVEWTPDSLLALIRSDTVPAEWIQQTVDYIWSNRQLLGIDKDVFLQAVFIARPDLHTILVTPDGDAWLEKCMLALGTALALSPVKGLLKGLTGA